jgi:hypothetical protein
MIVTAVPSYLNISNFGFGNVAGNEMTMMSARGDREGALRVFQSCWWLITIICSACILVLGAVLYLFPAAHYLRLHAIGETDTKWIIFYLGCSVLLGQLEALLIRVSLHRPVCLRFVHQERLLARPLARYLFPSVSAGARVTALVFPPPTPSLPSSCASWCAARSPGFAMAGRTPVLPRYVASPLAFAFMAFPSAMR